MHNYFESVIIEQKIQGTKKLKVKNIQLCGKIQLKEKNLYRFGTNYNIYYIRKRKEKKEIKDISQVRSIYKWKLSTNV